MCPDIFLPLNTRPGVGTGQWNPARGATASYRGSRPECGSSSAFDALETLALGPTCNIDLLTLLKPFDGQLGSDLKRLVRGIQTEFPQAFARSFSSLGVARLPAC